MKRRRLESPDRRRKHTYYAIGKRQKQARLAAALRAINAKFGDNTIHTGAVNEAQNKNGHVGD